MIEILRLQASDDFSQLVSLSKAFFAEYEAHHEEFFRIDTLNAGDIVAYFSRFVGSDDRAAFIALRDGEIIGYIAVYVHDQPPYWQVKRVGDISGLMVRADARQQGIASRLMGEARAFFSERGIKYYTVYTAVANTQAVGFYHKQGLEPLHTNFVGAV
jgi:ribosomal protein S18 acetylase RimI-like enzyme